MTDLLEAFLVLRDAAKERADFLEDSIEYANDPEAFPQMSKIDAALLVADEIQTLIKLATSQ